MGGHHQGLRPTEQCPTLSPQPQFPQVCTRAVHVWFCVRLQNVRLCWQDPQWVLKRWRLAPTPPLEGSQKCPSKGQFEVMKEHIVGAQ